MGNAAKLKSSRLRAWIRRTCAALFALLLAACTSAVTPTPTFAPPLTLTSTSRFSTHTGPVVRVTLPPTWTITPTPLPTLTPTPTPVTPTATATAAPSLIELCPSFTLTHSFANGHVFHWTDTLTLVVGTPLDAVTDPATGQVVPLTVRFLATNPLDGQNLGVQLPGGQVAIMELPIYQLPEPGLYVWSAGIYGDGIDEQCAEQGWFIVVRTADDLAALAQATSVAATVQAAEALASTQAAQTVSAETATAQATETPVATEMVE